MIIGSLPKSGKGFCGIHNRQASAGLLRRKTAYSGASERKIYHGNDAESHHIAVQIAPINILAVVAPYVMISYVKSFSMNVRWFA